MSNTLKFGNGEWYGKEGTILAYNDENNNYKPLPFDFSRASTATRVNKDGLIETVGADQPRVDYLNDSNGALLLEPSRSNIITNSNSSNLNFTLDNTSMTYNSITSPDGENNGILFKQTGSTASNSAYNFGLTTADGTYTYSIFIKANDSTKFRFYSSNGTALTQDFNPQEMTEGVVSGALNLKFESYGNDWFRVSFTRTLSSASHHRFSIYPDRNNTQKSVYIFGLQIESNASYATSYIPTQGSAVTRLADSCNNGGNEQVINSTEGVLYCEIAALFQGDGENRCITLSNGVVNSNTVEIFYQVNANTIKYRIKDGNGANFNHTETVTDRSQFNKCAIKYKSGDTSMWLNGVKVDTDTSTFAFTTTLSELNFSQATGIEEFHGNVKDVRVYNTALTDQELAALTQV